MSATPLSRALLAASAALALIGLIAPPSAAVTPLGTGALTGLNRPSGIVFGSDGAAVVGNNPVGPKTVSVFAPGATTASRTLTGLTFAYDVAIRPSTGEIFVADGGSVRVFDPGTTTANPAKTLATGPNAVGLAFAPNGDLYISNHTGNQVWVYSGNPLALARTFAVAPGPTGMGFHPMTGDLYVACYDGHFVQVFEPGSSTPNPAKSLVTGPTSSPNDVTFQPASGIAYVADYASAKVLAFTPGATTPSAAEELTGGTSPWSSAVDPLTGRLFVTYAGTSALPYAAPVPTVAAVTPNSGPVAGGQAVIVSGTNLGAVSAVDFGGVPGTAVTPMSPTQVQVVTPAHAVGAVSVSARWLSTAGVLANGYTFTATAPGPPTAVVATPGDQSATVSWLAPAATGGVPLTGYTVSASPGPAVCGTTATSCTIGPLINGTAYTFTVTASNSVGTSTPSVASTPVTPTMTLPLTVKKPRKASSKLPRRGTRTLVKSVRTSSKGRVVIERECVQEDTSASSASLCKFTVSKKGKVKVRTKGKRHVSVILTITAVPKLANPAISPSAPFEREWPAK